MIVYLVIVLVSCSCAPFEIEMPTLQEERLAIKMRVDGKEVLANVDLYEDSLMVCCKPNKSIFQIIHNFLSNPFFQKNQYSCPVPSTPVSLSEVTLPILGILQMTFVIEEAPLCERGQLGLNKKSDFMSYLPINAHTFSLNVNKRTDSNVKKIKLAFGQSRNVPSKPEESFKTEHPEYWDITVSTIMLGDLTLDTAAKVIFGAEGKGLQVPQEQYVQLMKYFPTNQTCRVDNGVMLCLCESGIPSIFPKFGLRLTSGTEMWVPLDSYMTIDSNICQLRFNPSPDEFWHFDVFWFEDTIFYFDRDQSQIVISQLKSPINASEDLIHLPIQLILNCCVVLLLCIFASMVVIELIKRLSGLSDAREENIREYVLRRNLQR